MLNLTLKSFYAATILEREQEWRDEYYSLPQSNSRERVFKAKMITEADKRIADIKKVIYELNQS